jgi:hypothetical protein
MTGSFSKRPRASLRLQSFWPSILSAASPPFATAISRSMNPLRSWCILTASTQTHRFSGALPRKLAGFLSVSRSSSPISGRPANASSARSFSDRHSPPRRRKKCARRSTSVLPDWGIGFLLIKFDRVVVTRRMQHHAVRRRACHHAQADGAIEDFKKVSSPGHPEGKRHRSARRKRSLVVGQGAPPGPRRRPINVRPRPISLALGRPPACCANVVSPQAFTVTPLRECDRAER